MIKRKCLLLASILGMLSVSVPLVASDSPDAGEVLSRFAKKRENYTSFIAEYEMKNTFNYPQFNWNGVTYYKVECRFDGTRGRSRFSIWGNVDRIYYTNVPKSQAEYTSTLWDEENRYSYTRVSQSDPGRVMMGREKDPGGVPKERKTFLQNTNFPGLMMGYKRGDNGKRIDEILGRAERIRLRRRTQKLRGADCYVIDAEVKGKGNYTLWIDPIHDYHIAKIHVRRKGGDYFNTRKIAKNDSKDEMHEIMRFQKIGDSWFPLEYKMKTKMGVNGRLAVEERIVHITNIVLDPDHDALKSFIPDDIPNGASVNIVALPPSLEFIWKDGKLVDKKGQEVDLDKLIENRKRAKGKRDAKH